MFNSIVSSEIKTKEKDGMGIHASHFYTEGSWARDRDDDISWGLPTCEVVTKSTCRIRGGYLEMGSRGFSSLLDIIFGMELSQAKVRISHNYVTQLCRFDQQA